MVTETCPNKVKEAVAIILRENGNNTLGYPCVFMQIIERLLIH